MSHQFSGQKSSHEKKAKMSFLSTAVNLRRTEAWLENILCKNTKTIQSIFLELYTQTDKQKDLITDLPIFLMGRRAVWGYISSKGKFIFYIHIYIIQILRRVINKYAELVLIGFVEKITLSVDIYRRFSAFKLHKL